MATDTERGARTIGVRILEVLGRAVLLLPRVLAALALAGLGRREQALARLRAVDPEAGTVETSRARAFAASLLLVPMAVVALLAALFATLNEIRVIFLYGLTDGGSIGPGTWGGPTLAGAWILHAVLGVLLLPVFVAVLIGLTRLAALFVHGLSVEARVPGWVTPVVLLVDAAAAVFLVAFVRQL